MQTNTYVYFKTENENEECVKRQQPDLSRKQPTPTMSLQHSKKIPPPEVASSRPLNKMCTSSSKIDITLTM